MSYNIHIPDPCFKHPRPNPTFRGQVVEEFLHLAIEALQARQIWTAFRGGAAVVLTA